jgi:hypothetical protein
MKSHIIVKILLVLCVASFAVVAGCSQIQAKVDHDVDSQLALALPDLDAAHAAAVAANDPNPAHDLCWSGLASAIRAQQAAEPPPSPASTAPIGLASAAQDFLMADVSPVVIHLPPLAPGVKSACFATIGELRVKANVKALEFSAAIAATMRGLKL